MARVPVAIEVPDCSQVQGILAGTKAKVSALRISRTSAAGLGISDMIGDPQLRCACVR